MIRAAGGVVVRGGRVLLVHRPRYDDWSLPKGKLEVGETWEQAAVREVAEETGLRAEITGEAGRTEYESRGEPKEVRYFRMTAVGEPQAQNEVDAVRWLPPADAAALLTYEADRGLVETLG